MAGVDDNRIESDRFLDVTGPENRIDELCQVDRRNESLAAVFDDGVAEIEKDTVDFRLNFDDSLEEPTVLPTRIPNLLINGASGIAVGMATNMPPHNLTEIIDATIAISSVENTTSIASRLKPDVLTAHMNPATSTNTSNPTKVKATIGRTEALRVLTNGAAS